MSSSNAGAWIYLVVSMAILVVPLGYIAVQQARHAKRLKQISRDTNGNITSMKRDQMHDLEAHVALIEKILRDRMSDEYREVVDKLHGRIERYREEIARREDTAE